MGQRVFAAERRLPMRKLTLLVAVFLVFAVSSHAESMWKPVVYLGAGASLPTGQFKNDFKTGYNIGGAAGVEYNSMFELLGELNFSRFPLDQGKFLASEPSGTSVSGGASKVLNVSGAAKYFIPLGGAEKVRPYILGRLGFAHLTESDLTLAQGPLSSTTSFAGRTKFTYGLGAGTLVDLNPNLSLWIEGRFTGINTPIHNTDFVPILAGFRYAFGKE